MITNLEKVCGHLTSVMLRPLSPPTRRCLFGFLGGLLACVWLTVFNLPAQGQLINLPKNVSVPLSDVSQEGNLDIGKAKLDGKVLFSIAAPATNESSNENTISPIERRVKSINYKLTKIVSDGFEPSSLTIDPAVLNNQTVLVASDQNWGPRYLLTVTPADTELDEPITIDGTAQKWAEIIRQALLQAQWERQFAYQKQQIPLILGIMAGMLLASVVIRKLQKWRRSQRHRLDHYRQVLLTSKDNDDFADAVPSELDETFIRRTQTVWYQSYLPRISLESQIECLLILRLIFVAMQVSLWFGGGGLILARFPQTRTIGDWLMRFPLAYIGIVLGIFSSKPILDSACRLILTRIMDVIQEKGIEYPRMKSRAITIFSVVKQFNTYLILIVGFLLFAYFINVLYFALIILVGLAFLVQNVLQDFVKTYFILSEDQYALGDVIQVDEVCGTVEKISLRNSQLRTVCGDLFIISHSSFNQIINLTHGQSGIKVFIDVAYSTNLDIAITVINQVAAEMQQDLIWGGYEIESDIKGVENFGDNSITIFLVLKTKISEQWTVAREYRRRLKSAFDRQGISIPFPQRSIWFENKLAMVDASIKNSQDNDFT